MPVKLGNKSVKNIYVGENPIIDVYVGNKKQCTFARYVEVHHISLEQNQYFNTGIFHNNTTAIISEFAPTNSNVCNIATGMGLIIIQSGNHLEHCFSVVNTTTGTASPQVVSWLRNLNLTGNVYYKFYYNIDSKNWAFEEDEVFANTKKSLSPLSEEESQYPIFINTGPYNMYKAKGNYRRTSIYNNGVLVFDGIPCLDRVTGNYGYYDVISQKFINEYSGKKVTGGAIVKNGYRFIGRN